MKFHKISSRHKAAHAGRGFTIVEMILSITILGILAGVTAPFLVSFYARYQLDSERSTLLTLLREARTMSLATEGSANHGVYIGATQYTIYEGASYAARDTAEDQTFPRATIVEITGGNEVTFAHLTALAPATTLVLNNGTKTSTVYVNTEASIDWQ